MMEDEFCNNLAITKRSCFNAQQCITVIVYVRKCTLGVEWKGSTTHTAQLIAPDHTIFSMRVYKTRSTNDLTVMDISRLAKSLEIQRRYAPETLFSTQVVGHKKPFSDAS